MEKQYGILHEIGDYYQPKLLTNDDNKKINEQLNPNYKKNQEKPIHKNKK